MGEYGRPINCSCVFERYVFKEWLQRETDVVAICSEWKGGAGLPIHRLEKSIILTHRECEGIQKNNKMFFGAYSPHINWMLENWGEKPKSRERKKRYKAPKHIPQGTFSRPTVIR